MRRKENNSEHKKDKKRRKTSKNIEKQDTAGRSANGYKRASVRKKPS
jgi:hypothetical protein